MDICPKKQAVRKQTHSPSARRRHWCSTLFNTHKNRLQ